VTLVDFAKYQGFDFQHQSDQHVDMEITLKKQAKVIDKKYEVFRRMEFNSDRKRMAIVLKDPKDGNYKMYIKGADSIIKDRLDKT
jgi:phospholipid-transporting ATPase